MNHANKDLKEVKNINRGPYLQIYLKLRTCIMLITVTNSKYSNQNQQYMSCININELSQQYISIITFKIMDIVR